MKIAQVAPLYETVPPKFYGGTERVIFNLTEELVALGHDVTLFASGDSRTSARLIAPCKRALWREHARSDKLAHHYIMLDQVRLLASEFDVLHFHLDYLHFPFSRACGVPHITTLHGRLDMPELIPVFRQFPHNKMVSISFSQREPLRNAHWAGNVYHGVPPANFACGAGKGGYLAFCGRVSPEKRVDRAIQIAIAAGMPLKIAARIDPVDEEYYESAVKPLLSHPGIEFIGEISDSEKNKFFGDAYAHLFPIDWPEPFGLAMIEAMACGTPTIAFRKGSVPEVLTPGVSGFIVDSMEAAVEAVPKIASLDRAACRDEFQRRFTSMRMAKDYLRIYDQLTRDDQAAVPLSAAANRPFSSAGSA